METAARWNATFDLDADGVPDPSFCISVDTDPAVQLYVMMASYLQYEGKSDRGVTMHHTHGTAVYPCCLCCNLVLHAPYSLRRVVPYVLPVAHHAHALYRPRCISHAQASPRVCCLTRPPCNRSSTTLAWSACGPCTATSRSTGVTRGTPCLMCAFSRAGACAHFWYVYQP